MQILTAPPRQADRGREFVARNPVEPVTRDGGPACYISVRLPSYRSLPLSCLEEVELTIGGVDIDAGDIELVLGGVAHPFNELPRLAHLWWFILDTGKLRVALAQPLAADTVRIQATLQTVEPYISNGRFHFTSSSDRVLDVAASRVEGVLRG